MKILFVLSQMELTGAETYAMTLASALEKRGDSVVFVSDLLQEPGSFKFYPLPIHSKNNSYWGRIQNIISMRKIIQEEKIELIHSHSRAANLVSFFAKGKIPMVVTIHGRWRNHFAARTLPCLGDRTIAICPYLERYLISDILRPSQTIRMVPNGIDPDKFSPNPSRSSQPEILFVGRFSGQKGNVIRFLLQNVFPSVVQRVSPCSIKIVSSSPSSQDREFVSQFNQNASSKAVSILESTSDLVCHYRSATIIVGSGRVALEGMSCAKPVFAIGESSAPGLLSSENFMEAFDSNFGDCGEWNLFLQKNREEMVQDLVHLIQDPAQQNRLSQWGRETILQKFHRKTVADQVSTIYGELLP